MAAAAVAAAAVVDVVRPDEQAGPPEAEAQMATIEGQEAVVSALAALGARGVLELSDDACRRTLLSLPSLIQLQTGASCRPEGTESPDRRRVARCGRDGVEVVSTVGGAPQRLLPGCAPAWRPDGTLTAAFEDEIVRFRDCAQAESCPVTLIGREQLQRAARRHPKVPDRIGRLRALVDEIAWLSPRQAAVAISIRLRGRYESLGALSTIAFFDNGELRPTEGYFRITGGRLEVSPRRRYVTQTPDVVLRADGSPVVLPQPLRDARDFAWSPDERWLVVAGRYALTVVDAESLERDDTTGSGPRSVTLPQAAAQVDWR